MAEKTTIDAALRAAAETAQSFGLTPGMNPENVRRRVEGLTAHGTDPLIARALALDAENIQVHQDNQSAKERKDAEVAAQNAVPALLKTLTLEKLIAWAREESVEIPSEITLKKDVLAFLLKGHEEASKAGK